MAERSSALGGCQDAAGTHCGFMAPSAFDRAAEAAAAAAGGCTTVVLTAILGGFDILRQPLRPPDEATRDCFFAFVDARSLAANVARNGRSGRAGETGGDAAAGGAAVGGATTRPLPRAGWPVPLCAALAS